MRYSWIKLYIEILDDPKIGLMPDWVFRRFIQFLLYAREYNHAGLLGPVSELAWRLRSSDDDMLSALRTMSEIGIVAETPDGWLIVNFVKRQDAQSGAERVREYRKRKEDDVTKRYRTCNESETLPSISTSDSVSDSVSFEGGGVEGGTRLPQELEFYSRFGEYHGVKEKRRWDALCESVGFAKAQEIAAWAEKKEIHMDNRPSLMDSMETAARTWREKTNPSGRTTKQQEQAAFFNRLKELSDKEDAINVN